MATEELTIQIQAKFNNRKFKEAEKAVENVRKETERATKSAGRFDGAYERASKSLSKNFGPALTLATGAAVALTKVLKDGFSAQTTRATFEVLSQSINASTEFMNNLRLATNGAVDDLSLMSGAIRFINLGIAETEEEATQLIEAAVKLGKTMGQDASTAIEDFGALLANQSIPRLDNFGISSGRVRTRIAELQAEFPNLTREVAFTQAVLEEAEKSMDRLGEAVTDSVDPITRLSTIIKNEYNEAAETMANGTLALVDSIDAMTDQQQDNIDTIVKASDTYEDYRHEIFNTGQWFKAMSREEFEARKGIIANTIATEAWVEQQRQIADAQQAIRDLQLANTIDTYRKSIEQQEEVQDEAVSTDFRRAEALIRVDNALEQATRAEERLRAVEESRETGRERVALQRRLTAGILDRARATEELAQANRAAFGGEFLQAADNMEDFKDIMFETAVQEGLTATETAILAQSLGVLDEAAIKAQLTQAALATKAKELGEAVANGDITINGAVQALEDFQSALLDGSPTIGDYAQRVDDLTGNAREAESAVRDTALALDDLDGKNVTASVTVTTQGRVGQAVGQAAGAAIGGLLDQANDAARQAGTAPQFRAHGGAVQAGQPFVVGERGRPEVFIPSQNGMIVSNNNSTNTTNNFSMNVNTSAGQQAVTRGFDLMRGIVGA